jgi:hypothetical protein
LVEAAPSLTTAAVMIAIFFMTLSSNSSAKAGVDAQESGATALSARFGCLSAVCQDEERSSVARLLRICSMRLTVRRTESMFPLRLARYSDPALNVDRRLWSQ